ncbi:hypothetical protein GO755_40065 [Spirosoma sp. HMF4905]|uniref:Uncharacterized protein n=1 Tax=Spirosoma arboris TaxID=2682092 RepID=A0A7K1SRE9_9BACT|nr:hypothetical protein [Spirosoma arboris]MVM36273.1 hypothetical protein [Spirosoma arboris]
MKTLITNHIIQAGSISRPQKITRFRKVAHVPSRAWAAVQILLNTDKVRDYWRNLIKTDIEEYFRLMEEGMNEDRDFQKERRIQKPNNYICNPQTV